MRRAVLVLLLAAALGGCAGTKPTTQDTGAAPEPVVDAQTGSIAGLVFDAELTPIPGANVTIKDGPSATSDAQGAFTLNGLPPGTHALDLRAEGFVNASKKVNVGAGEIAQIRAELVALPTEQAYHWSFSKVGMLRLGQWSVQYLQHTVNQSAVDALFCDPCAYPIVLRPNIADAVTDVAYTRAVGLPLINEYVTVAYSTSQASGSQLKLLMTHDFKPRDSYQWSTVQVRELRGFETVRLEFHGPDTEPPGVVVNQRIELWQTFAHGAMLPPGYTLLPPS